MARVLLVALTMTGLLGLPHFRACEDPGRDANGDPLPPGALQRLGSLRWHPEGNPALVGFLNEDRELLSVTQKGLAEIWDIPEGRLVRQFRICSPQPVIKSPIRRVHFRSSERFLALSANGRTLAVYPHRDFIYFWDTATGKEIGRIPGDNVAENPMAVSPDGRQAAVMRPDRSVEIFDVTTAKRLRVLSPPAGEEQHAHVFVYLNYSDNGKRLILAGVKPKAQERSGLLIIWDPTTGQELHQVQEAPFNKFHVADLILSRDGSLLAINELGKIYLIDLTGQQAGKTLRVGPQETHPNLIFSPDGARLFSQLPVDKAEPEVNCWDVAKGVPSPGWPYAVNTKRIWTQHRNLAVSRDGSKLAWVDGAMLRLYDLEKKRSLNPFHGPTMPIREIEFSADGSRLVSRATDYSVFCWDLKTGKAQRDPPPPDSMVVLSPNELIRAMGSPSGPLHLVDTATGKVLHPLNLDPPVGIRTLTFSQDGRFLATLSASLTVKEQHLQVFDTRTGKVIFAARIPRVSLPAGNETTYFSHARRAIFSPENRYVLAEAGPMRIWDLENQSALPPFSLGKLEGLRSAAFSPDSRTLAIETVTGNLTIWEVGTGKRRRVLLGGAPYLSIDASRPDVGVLLGFATVPEHDPCALAYSPDGRWLLQSSANGQGTLWHLPSRQSLPLPKGHRGALMGAAFAPDGQRLATSGLDTTILIWKSAPLMAPLLNQPPPPRISSLPWEVSLASDDANLAGIAISEMISDPVTAITLLARVLAPQPTPNQKRIQQWVAELDDEDYQTRDVAAKSLERWGSLTLPILREILQGNPNAEVRRAVTRLVDRLNAPGLTGEELKALRGIEVLEAIGTKDVLPLLETLAQGPQGNLATREAQRSLERLKAASQAKPGKEG